MWRIGARLDQAERYRRAEWHYSYFQGGGLVRSLMSRWGGTKRLTDQSSPLVDGHKKEHHCAMTDHITSPEPHHSPYAHMSDEDLTVAYERVAADPDSTEAPAILAELTHRGIAKA